MPRVQPRRFAISLLSFIVACGASSNQQPAERGSADSGAFSGTVASAAAPAPSSRADSSIEAMVTAVTNDVIALRGATPAVAVGKLPAHEKLVKGMLATFESRIRAMHVEADPSWTSVIDSVRTDLAHLPSMPAASLPTFLPQHLNRVMRIVACIQMVKS
jgi:hypothetical protein